MIIIDSLDPLSNQEIDQIEHSITTNQIGNKKQSSIASTKTFLK